MVLNAPSREGYIFEGWYTDESLTAGPVTSFSANTLSDITFYAKWVEESEPDMVSTTLINEAHGISVSGIMSPNVKLMVEKLKEGNLDFDKIKESYKNGTLKDLWKIALQNSDGSLADWSGNLVIRIKIEENLNLEKIKMLLLEKGQLYDNISFSMDRDELVIVTDTLGSYAIMETAEPAKDENDKTTGDKNQSGEDADSTTESSEHGDDDTEKDETEKKEQESNQNNKNKSNPDTGDDTPIALVVLCLILSVFGIVAGVTIRKKENRK